MTKTKTRKNLPRLKVEITTRPATAADRRALNLFWKRLLAGRSEGKNGEH